MGQKFNLYFAGSPSKVTFEKIIQRKQGILFTFADSFKPYRKFCELENSNDCKVFMDSGAFSVYHSGAEVDLDKYIEEINMDARVTVFAQMDVIPYPVLDTVTARESANGSWDKYLYMMKRVKPENLDKVIPIYHFGEPIGHLERLLNTEVEGRLIPYIGVGGRHGITEKAHDLYFSNLFKVVKKSKNPNVKIHAFGMTNTELLVKFPFYSADSTSWLKKAVNGVICTKHCRALVISSRLKNKPGSYYTLNRSFQKLIRDEIEEKGYVLEELMDDYKKRWLWNIDYYADFADNYEFKGESNIKRRKLI